MEEPRKPDHDLLIEISTKLDIYILQSNNTLQDHETRLRRVEALTQKLKGAQWLVTGVATLATIIISALQLFL